jgi:predicted phosphoadenosine phosphosulfate sulfurtransferase
MSAFPSPEHKIILLTQLRTLGVKTVEVTFSGGGDSGSIDDVNAYDNDMKDVDLMVHSLDWPEEVSTLDTTTKTWVHTEHISLKSLDHILRNVTESALAESGLDWYNNDGGQGSLLIDFNKSPPEISLDVGINYTTTEDHTIDLNEEDEDAPMSP